MKRTGLCLLTLFSLVLMGFDERNMENRAPAEVERFAEQNYRDFILNIINDSNADTFNFTKGDQEVTIGRVIPVNRLVIDRQLNITVEPPGEWVVPVYQSGAVKNVVNIWEPFEGKYEIAGIGYPYWLTYSIVQMEQDEYYIHNMQYDLEFAYSPSKNRVRPLGDSSIRSFNDNGLDPNGITKTEFIAFVKQHLKNTYPNQFNEGNKESESWFAYIFGGIVVLLLISGFFFLKRQKRSMKG
ncbi:hypothetical protein DYI25_04665 [Mesobacillus boroniphilus]|uniref:Uncharacterized protein n=1 Tax=Mesobacillus boroniphilus TaxID=308892 RepID=A0A944CJQ5_9BACI|nr:hypothetical protein [Mesobacillus boroniphilus]MBS8263735.1 hypothetical protein [Mesobacillus boroniphilus]